MASINLKDLKLDEIVGDIRDEASKRASGLFGDGQKLFGESQKQARHALGADDSNSFAIFALGILVGAIAGAAIALLMTPVSGNEARKRLGQQVSKVRSGDEGGAHWETTGGNGSVGTGYGATAPTYNTPKV